MYSHRQATLKCDSQAPNTRTMMRALASSSLKMFAMMACSPMTLLNRSKRRSPTVARLVKSATSLITRWPQPMRTSNEAENPSIRTETKRTNSKRLLSSPRLKMITVSSTLERQRWNSSSSGRGKSWSILLCGCSNARLRTSISTKGIQCP